MRILKDLRSRTVAKTVESLKVALLFLMVDAQNRE